MNALLALPIVIPLMTAALSILLRRRLRWQRGLAVLGMGLLLCSSVYLFVHLWRSGEVLATQVGAWPFPYGITLVADLFSGIMLVLAGLIGISVAIFSLGSVDDDRESFGYYPLLHILLMGVCGAFLTGDIFNMYVWYEVMLMASFVLLALGGEPGQLRAAITYVTLNLVASAFFLAAVGLLYGVAGTLNMADLAWKLNQPNVDSGIVTTLSLLFLVAFGIKSAIFPLFFWLPASYHTPPIAVSAVFAGLLTKVGVYTLIRVFTLIFVQDTAFTHGLLLVLAGLTMVTGVLGAAAQNEVRRILSFHIVSQIGYMIMGLALFGLAESRELQVIALTGSVFYVLHHIVVKTNLFLISGVIHKLHGTLELKQLGGLYQSRPAIALLFLIPAFSLAGIPPLSGFFAKLSLVRAGLIAEQYAIVAVALAVGLLTLYSMTKIWAEAFWKAPPLAASEASPEPVARGRLDFGLLGPVAGLAATTLAISFSAGFIYDVASVAASQLVDHRDYITAVRGDDAR